MNYLGETIHRYSLTFAALASLREKSSFVTFVPSWWKLSLVLVAALPRCGKYLFTANPEEPKFTTFRQFGR